MKRAAVWVAWVALLVAVLVGLGAVIAVSVGVPREKWATPHGLMVGGFLAFMLVGCVVVVCGILGGLTMALWDAGAALWRQLRGR